MQDEDLRDDKVEFDRLLKLKKSFFKVFFQKTHRKLKKFVFQGFFFSKKNLKDFFQFFVI